MEVRAMRLEPGCRLEMEYEPDAACLVPYGDKEGAGFGYGKGTVRGSQVRGKGVWANHPRRREDGVWCPDCHGFITTDEGVKTLGYSIDEATSAVRRAILATIWFSASGPAGTPAYILPLPPRGGKRLDARRVGGPHQRRAEPNH